MVSVRDTQVSVREGEGTVVYSFSLSSSGVVGSLCFPLLSSRKKASSDAGFCKLCRLRANDYPVV